MCILTCDMSRIKYSAAISIELSYLQLEEQFNSIKSYAMLIDFVHGVLFKMLFVFLSGFLSTGKRH